MKKTLLMEVIEADLGIPIEVYLYRMMKGGWKLDSIADDIFRRTGITVSNGTLSVWTRGMGYSIRQAAEDAWNHGIISQANVQRRQSPPDNVRHINAGR